MREAGKDQRDGIGRGNHGFLSLPAVWVLGLLGSGVPTPQAEEGRAAWPPLIVSDQAHGRIGLYGRTGDPGWIVIDLGAAVVPDEVIIFPARVPGSEPGGPVEGFPPDLEVRIAASDSFASSVRLGRRVETGTDGAGGWPFWRLPGNGASGRFLRIEITGSRLGPGGRGRFFTLGEVVVLENGRNAALGRPVRASSSTENGPRWQARNLTDGFLWCEAFAGADESPGNGYHSRVETTGPEGRKWVEVDLGEPRVIDTITLIPARPPDFADVSGFGFPPRFRVVLDDRTVFESGPDPFPNPGSAAVQLPVSGVVGRRVRLEAVELWRRTGDYLLAMAELEVWSGPENVALGRPVTGLDNLETGRWKAAFLTDGFSSQRSLLGWKGWLDGVSARIAGEERQRVELAALEERRTEARERWIVFSGTAAVVAALLGVIALMWQRRQAEREREALRVRIAQDLHDEIGASLSHLALQGDLAAGKLGPEHPVHGRLVTLAATARETLGTMRDLVWLLAPVAGTWREFCLRLTEIGERLGGDFVVDVSMAGDVPSGGPAVAWAREIVLFFKEVLTNARRHSGADGVEVLIRWGTASFTLVVRDRGCGFDPDDPSFQGGAGLRSLRARAARLRGRCEIRSEAGAGTTVVLQAPLLN